MAERQASEALVADIALMRRDAAADDASTEYQPTFSQGVLQVVVEDRHPIEDLRDIHGAAARTGGRRGIHSALSLGHPLTPGTS